MNVGVTVKNIGAYVKVPSRGTPENLKPSNSKNNINNNSNNSNSNNSNNPNSENNIKYNKQPNGSNHSSNPRQSSIHSNANNRMQGSDSVNSLPRIRLSS